MNQQINATKPAKNIRMIKLFSDHMVLQQEKHVPIWGSCDPGGVVSVRFAGQIRSAIADEEGRWKVRLDPMPAGGPFKLSVQGQEILEFEDIMVGEVWIGSGQSNMEMPLAGWGEVNNYEQEIAAAEYPMIRLLQVRPTISTQPERDLPTDGWRPCSPATIEEFSSTAYFFGRKLHQELDVAIGLVQSTWSGTVIEAWISGDTLKNYPEFIAEVERIGESDQADDRAKLATEFVSAYSDWLDTLRAMDPGYHDPAGKWYQPEISNAQWHQIELPVTWQRAGLKDFDGTIWFRRNIQIPQQNASMDLLLKTGPIRGIDSIWFNGVLITNKHIWEDIRAFTIPAKYVRPGQNTIVIRIIDSGGEGGIWGDPEQMYIESGQEFRIWLAGKWSYRIGLDLKNCPQPPEDPNNPNHPVLLSNAMIEPLIPFAIRGVIWYQGESNVARAKQYIGLFAGLINDWRRRWATNDFPFIYVQLANWLEKSTEPVESEWAELREAQLMNLTIPNTGMVVTIDIGDATDIHPKNKQEVGRRLALSALKIAYDRNIDYSGPVFRGMSIVRGEIIIEFDHAGSGLMTPGEEDLAGFAIAGNDRVFYWANAEIRGKTVAVSCKEVPSPIAVRYAWADNPECSLYNSAGLPASPFRSDHWPGITDNKK